VRSADDDLVSAPTTDRVITAEQPRRLVVARWIRRLAVPIILGWIALIALLNLTVPQLEVVGQMRSVSMSPKEAPSVAAMMRVGKVFQEFDSDNSAMIVLEGDKPVPRRLVLTYRNAEGAPDPLEDLGHLGCLPRGGEACAPG